MANTINLLKSAVALQQQGEFAKAVSLLRRVLAKDARNPDALHLLGLSLNAQGDLAGAFAHIRKAIAIKPTEPVFLTNAGIIAVAAGDIGTGISYYRQALTANPDYAEACNNLGLALQKLGFFEQARISFLRALEIKPGIVAAMVNLGNVLRDLGRDDEAVEQYKNAIEAAPNLVEAHNNLGNAYRALQRYDEAIESYRRALAIRPDYSETYFNLGVGLSNCGDLESADEALQRAVELRPDPWYRLAHAGLLPVIPHSRSELVEWRKRFRSRISALAKEGLVQPGMPLGTPVMDFFLAYHGENERENVMALAALLRQMYPALVWTTPHSHPRPSQDGRRIRIGFFSTYLRRHAVAWTVRGLFESMPKDRFELIAFTTPHYELPVLPQIRAAVDRVVMVSASVERAREVIADARLDVLIFADIGMERLSYGLAHARLAPVQCALWGHPVTTGIPTVDYYLSSDFAEPPDAADHYSERLVRLGGVQTCYRRPPVPDRAGLTRPAGISEASTLYLCPQSLFKIHPDMDGPLSDILRRDPSGVLVLFEGVNGVMTARLKARWSGVFGGLMDRVHFLPRCPFEGFMEVLAVSDVLLDTWPFGSGNTSYQSFALGKPVVTFPGKYLRGRGVLAHYRHMGVLDCVASSAEEYVEIAVRLGTDEGFYRHVAALIADRSGVLFDDTRVSDDLCRFLAEVAG